MTDHDGKWQEVTVKLVDRHQYIGAKIWLDPNKRTSDMLNNDEKFLAIIWQGEYYSIAKTAILWVNEHIGIKDTEYGY